jgi:hypothetical protein
MQLGWSYPDRSGMSICVLLQATVVVVRKKTIDHLSSFIDLQSGKK